MQDIRRVTVQALRQSADSRALDGDCPISSPTDGVAVVDAAVGHANGGGVDDFEGEVVDMVGHATCEEVGQSGGGLGGD